MTGVNAAPGASVGNRQRVATPRTDEKWNTIPVRAPHIRVIIVQRIAMGP